MQISKILCGTLITPSTQLNQVVLSITGDRVSGIEPLQTPYNTNPQILDARDAIVIPGLVDVQVNGAMGYSFLAHDGPYFNQILAHHLKAGTTTLLPTIVTATEETLIASLSHLAESIASITQADPQIPGVHLEGPFLNPQKSGAHDPQALRQPDLATMKRLVLAASGKLRMVTLAPELPEAESLIRYLVTQNICVSAGHTAATYADLQCAIAAGLRLVTHAGNASDWPHRAIGELGFLASEPGLVGTFMADEHLCGGIILDGFHFHPALLAPLLHLKGPDKLFLVSDAAPVTGCPPGDYDSGGLLVTIHPQGFATSGRGGGWLAGSVITLIDAVRRAVQLAGIPLQTAVHMATLGPASALDLGDQIGRLTPGAVADALILETDLSLRQVIRAGQLAHSN